VIGRGSGDVEVEATGKNRPTTVVQRRIANSFRDQDHEVSDVRSSGALYTYLSHGIHVCANVVIAHDGVAGASCYEPLRYGT